MSPAAEMLENLRTRRNLSQAVFARLTGLHASYVSAIIHGKQHIPAHPKFLEQVSTGLALTQSQRLKLECAINQSPKTLAIPADADREVFLLAVELREHMAEMDGELASSIRREIARYFGNA